MTDAPTDAKLFRSAMSRLGAAVNIITTDGPAGRHGMTASAVCSVTDTPPTVLVCVNRDNRSHRFFVENRALCINVLAARHQALSLDFARQTVEDRFAGAGWSTLVTGAPALEDATVALDCRISARQEVGTHSVFFCAVQATRIWDGAAEGLIWFDRQFHPLAATG
ncbi:MULTISPECIES: flavin reductase [Agrobacterium]|uniref:Flavin reductase n=1 Tax=Agrobacterium larrymoorei TaxID=160699 RepID=A0ABU0UFS2_9HYPH|nr:flavin reductase [Agrobacterium larrymoorei]MDQ1183728.1 flavin reductase [Agrobacterium larrymoorei]MDQ1195430.1 flavin reductase [Rhizobium sp. SORGH_AS_0787]